MNSNNNQNYNQGFNSGYQQGYQQGFQQSYQQMFDPVYGSPQFQQNELFAESPEGKSRGTAALLCLFLGYLGVHMFYLGKPGAGVIYLLLTFCTCGSIGTILAFIQAIMLFCMNNQDFRRKYILSNSTFPF